MAVARPSALAGVLYAGEPSLPRVLAGLEQQRDAELRTVVIGHHPFDEAHRRLYRTFDERRSEHDVMVKVDADMEIVAPRLLSALGHVFLGNPGLDMIVLGVDDWLSGERIMGMNAWRRGIRWRAAPSPLFADLPATDVRTRLKILDAPETLVLHATSPSPAQSRRYGAQRGLKVLETLKRSRLERMQDFVRFVVADPAHERLIAVAGLEAALTDRDLARRCLFGNEEFSHDDQARIEQAAADPELCGRTLERLAELEGRVSIQGSGSDRSPTVPNAGAPGLLHRVAAGLRRRRTPALADREQLRSDFLAALSVD